MKFVVNAKRPKKPRIAKVVFGKVFKNAASWNKKPPLRGGFFLRRA
jgi:hypothetical protein